MVEHNAPQQRRRGCRWQLLLPLLLIVGVVGAIFWLRMTPSDDLDEVQTIAHRLGDTPETHLRWFHTCWESYPLGGYCTIDVHFTTTLPHDEFAMVIEEETGDLTTIERGRGQGSLLYTDFSIGSQKGEARRRITANGEDELSLSPPEPTAYKWEFKDKEQRSIYIRFYDIMNSQDEYRLDDVILNHNIVTVRLHL